MDNKQPTIPPSIIIFFPACIIGWAGTKVTGGDFSFARPSWGMIVGAASGLLIGLAVWLDDKLAKQRLAKVQQDKAPEQGMMPSQPESAAAPSEWLAGLMLVIPALVGLLLWQHDILALSTQVLNGLSFLAIISTSVLGYADARQLTRRMSGKGVDTSSINPALDPALIFVGMLGMWILCFPAYFLHRRRLGARNLLFPAIIVTFVFFAPALTAFFSTD